MANKQKPTFVWYVVVYVAMTRHHCSWHFVSVVFVLIDNI